MWSALQLAVLLPLLLYGGGDGQTTCPVFGETGNAGTSTRTRLFMNFDSPSQCSGRVVAWNYCYYRDGEEGDILGARFLVYRRNLTTGVYHQVPNSLYTLLVRYEDLQASNNFGCSSVTLNSTNQFDIMENDIVAACIMEDVNAGINPLYLTADPGELNRARQVGDSNFELCTNEQLGTITQNQIRSTENRLALHATISAGMPCRVGDNPEPSNPDSISNSGHFLNTRFPAECDGVVTAWNYCFYPDGMSVDGTYSATVALWRPASGLYNIVEGSITVLRTQRVRSHAHIHCSQESLTPENHVDIRRGDVVGVLIPRDLDIPMIGFSGTYGIHRDQVQQASPSNQLSVSRLNLENDRIHLYADVVTATITTEGTPTPSGGTSAFTSGAITEDMTTSMEFVNRETTSTSNSNLQASTNPPAENILVIGVSAGAPIFISLLVIGTLLIVFISWKFNNKSLKSYACPIDSNQQQEESGDIEITPNQVYGLRDKDQIMEMTQNQVYGLGAAEEIKMSSNPGYRAFETSQTSAQEQENMYEVVDKKTSPQTQLELSYDYVSNN